MAAAIPTSPPSIIRAGDTVQFTIDSLTDYSAADGWALTYFIVGPGGAISQAATTYLTRGFAVTLTATQTALLAPGEYSIEGKVSLGAEVYTVYSSRLTVLLNMSTATEATETRSYWRQVRDALRDLLRTTAPSPIAAYNIFGQRSVNLMTLDERLKMLALAEANVRNEDVASGSGSKNVLMRFRNAR